MEDRQVLYKSHFMRTHLRATGPFQICDMTTFLRIVLPTSGTGS